MPASSPPDDISKPSSSTYLGAGATILGLRQRSRFKSSRKYFVRIHIDGKEEWTSREIRTKESKVVWDDDQDRHEFKCSLTSLFRVTLFRNRRGARPSEEIGTLARPLQEWIQAAMVGQLITSSPEKNGLSIEIQMSRMYEDADVPDSTAALQEVVEGLGPVNGLEATANSAVLLTTKESGSDNPTTAISSSGELSNGVADVAGALEGLLETLHMFVRSMDAQTEVHPYLKMAWTILSTALNIAVVQQEHNNKMKLLIEKITMVYGFICDARELRHDKARLGVLSRLALQTVDCAYFISSHIDDTHLVTRLAKQTLFSTDTKIDEYSKSFDYMLQEFRTGSQLRTELATLSMSEGVKELSANASLQNIPFVGGTGYEPGKECFENTRTALLDEITEWATSGTAKVLVLTGPAGTGKSTIAHTMAGRFLKIKRLGAAFCFTSTPSRKPVDLFRNIAHGLASLDGAFKAALEDAVKDDKDLCQTNDVMRQFDNFILGPAHTLMPHGTIFVMIDAFDESGTLEERKTLLRIVRHRFKELPLGFRVLVTSRDEWDIHDAFPQSTADIVVRRMPTLQNDPQLSKDILRYIQHTLSPDGSLLPGLPRDACETLGRKADGMFQWACEICRYILGPRIGVTAAQRYYTLMAHEDTSLDGFYQAVLLRILEGNVDILSSFKLIMGVVLATVEPLSMRPLNTLLCALRPTGSPDVYGILPFLGSLLSGVQEDTVPIRPVHFTLSDFLRSTRRSRRYFIGTNGHHENIVIASLRLLRTNLCFNMADLKSSYVVNADFQASSLPNDKVSVALLYACKYWGYHLSQCAYGFETSNEECKTSIRDLVLHKMLFWLELSSLAGTIVNAVPCLRMAMVRLQAIGSDVSRMAEDCIQFIRRFGRSMVDSAPHIYLSALVWSPSESKIVEQYASSYPKVARVTSGRDSRWSIMSLVLSGHRFGVACVAFSADGRRIVSGSWDHTLRLWDGDIGDPIGRPLAGHNSSVTSVSFSPDGRVIVSGSDDQTLRLWDADTGESIGEPFTGHEDCVTSVAFSPDGRRIASASRDQTVRLWDSLTQTAIGQPFTGHSNWVTSVAFSPDGRRIVSGSWDHTLRVWDGDTGAAIGNPLAGHKDGVTSVAFSSDGRRIVSGSSDHTLRLWDGASGDAIGNPLTGHTAVVDSVAFSPDGQRIVSASWDHTLRLWDGHTGEAIGGPLTGHSNSVTSVAFSPDSRCIISGSWDYTLRVWDGDPHQAIAESFPGHRGAVTSVAFSPDGGRIVSGSRDRTVRLWDASTGEAIGEPFIGHTNWITSVAFSPDGRQIVSGSWDHSLRLWDAETGKAIGEPLVGESVAVNSVAFSQDGKRIVSGLWDHTVQLWDACSGKAIGEPFVGHSSAVVSVAFSPDGLRVVSGSCDHTLQLWDVESGKALGEALSGHNNAVNAVAFSPDDRRLVSGSRDYTLCLWDSETGKIVGEPMTGHSNSVTSVAISPCGAYIVSGSRDYTVRLWDIETRQAIGDPMAGHRGAVTSVAFSPDGRHIVSSSEDQTVRVWNVNMGGIPALAAQRGAGIIHASLSPQRDSSELHTGTLNKGVGSGVTTNALSLSPFKAHQLTQPYPSQSIINCSLTFDLQAGWIKGNGSDHILWVPPDKLRSLYGAANLKLVIPGPTLHVDLSHFAHGTHWTSSHFPNR